MILVSSFRAMGDHGEYDLNQLNAHASWDHAAEWIYYVNDPEPLLASLKTEFVPTSEKFPFIRELVAVAARQTTWTAILNADICLSPDLPFAQIALHKRGAMAAISHRYEFEPAVGCEPSKVVDSGLDFFCALPSVWQRMLSGMPPALRIGHQRWDTWMLGWLCAGVAHLWDITPCRMVYHPKHDGRRFEHDIQIDVRQFLPVCWPRRVLTPDQLRT